MTELCRVIYKNMQSCGWCTCISAFSKIWSRCLPFASTRPKMQEYSRRFAREYLSELRREPVLTESTDVHSHTAVGYMSCIAWINLWLEFEMKQTLLASNVFSSIVNLQITGYFDYSIKQINLKLSRKRNYKISIFILTIILSNIPW